MAKVVLLGAAEMGVAESASSFIGFVLTALRVLGFKELALS